MSEQTIEMYDIKEPMKFPKLPSIKKVPYDQKRILKADKTYKFPIKGYDGDVIGWAIYFREKGQKRFKKCEVFNQ